MNRTAVSLLLLVALLALGVGIGCSSAAKKRALEAKKQAIERANLRETTTNLALIEQNAVDADQETTKIIAMLGENPPNVPMIKARAESVKGSLGKVIPGIRIAGKQSLVAKGDYDAITGRVKELQDDRDKSLFSWLDRFVILGVVTVAGGVLISLLAPRIPGIPILAAGGDVAVFGGTLAGLSLALRMGIRAIGPYQWIPGLTAAVAISFAIVWFGWKALRRVKLRKAVTQMSEGIAHAEAVTAPDVHVAALVSEKLDEPTKKLLNGAVAGGELAPS